MIRPHAVWWKFLLGAAISGGVLAGGETGGAADGLCLPPSSPPALVGVEVGPQVGQRAPDFTLPDLSGSLVQLSSFRGCPVLLDFWATWCTPCLSSVPWIETLYQKHAEQGLKVVMVNLDYHREAGARYLAAQGYSAFIALWAPFSETRAVAYRYGIVAIPHTVFIDRDGIIRFSGPPALLTEDVLAPWL